MDERLCEACERGDHANCGQQTWCECDCDPFVASVDAAFPRPDDDLGVPDAD